MYEECSADIRMTRMILKEGFFDKATYHCSITIRERYWNKVGRIVKFQIRNGFYKNLVN